ncbi:hypothetical protein L9F63_014680, partial [Diploptera punctata]
VVAGVVVGSRGWKSWLESRGWTCGWKSGLEVVAGNRCCRGWEIVAGGRGGGRGCKSWLEVVACLDGSRGGGGGLAVVDGGRGLEIVAVVVAVVAGGRAGKSWLEVVAVVAGSRGWTLNWKKSMTGVLAGGSRLEVGYGSRGLEVVVVAAGHGWRSCRRSWLASRWLEGRGRRSGLEVVAIGPEIRGWKSWLVVVSWLDVVAGSGVVAGSRG